MEPYYTIMRLPGETAAEFIQMLPFTPRRRDNLASWMVARSDGEHYGQLLVFQFPEAEAGVRPAPGRRAHQPGSGDRAADHAVEPAGLRGDQGTLMVIPIEESLIYVRPLYLRAQAGRIPELTRVIVAYQNQIVMERTLEAGLTASLVRRAQRPQPPLVAGATGATGGDRCDRCRRGGPTEGAATRRARMSEKVAAEARATYDRAIAAQKAGDWARYGRRSRSWVSFWQDCVSRPLERRPWSSCASGKPRDDLCVPVDQRRNVPAQRRAVLEAVAGSSAHNPALRPLRMAIDDEVAGRGVLVHTDARFHKRGVAQRRNAATGKLSSELHLRRIDDTRDRFGIDHWTVAIDADLHPASIEIGEAVQPCREIYPHWEPGRRAARRVEIQHFLTSGPDPCPNRFGKHPRQPGTARKDVGVSVQRFACAQGHAQPGALLVDSLNVRGSIGNAACRVPSTRREPAPPPAPE